MRIRIIDTLDALNGLAADWTRLESAASYPTQQFIWMQACALTFSRPGELRIIVVEDNDAPIAIAPLIQRKGTRVLEFLGACELQEPTDAIYANEQAVHVLATALVEVGLPLFLDRIPEESLLPSAMAKAYRARGVLIRRPNTSCPTLALDPSCANPEGVLNAGRRSDLRRAQRKASELGAVSSEILSPTAATVEPLLEEALTVEASSWKKEARSAVAVDPIRGPFYRRYALAASEKGILRLSFLRINGRATAMQLAVETCSRLWLFKIGYDAQFAKCSPGNLLLRNVIQHSAERGLKAVEFLGASEPWIQVWTQRGFPCATLRGYPLGLASAAQLAKDLMKSAWCKLSRVGGIRK